MFGSAAIHAKLDRILELLTSKGKETMPTLQDLQAAVTATTTVQASAMTLITGLGAQLAALSAQLSTQGVDASAVESLASQLSTQAQAFASAIFANTPGAAPAPNAPPPPAPAPAPPPTA